MGALEVKDDSVINCVLCGNSFHKTCETDWDEKFHADGSWLCDICHKIESAWTEEDFEYDEIDFNDEIERNYFSGADKAKAARRCRENQKVKFFFIPLDSKMVWEIH